MRAALSSPCRRPASTAVRSLVLAALGVLAFGACATTPSVTPPAPVVEDEAPPVVAPAPLPPVGPRLTVRVIYVGQGDGILIISPTGKTILLDAGDRGKHKLVLEQLGLDGISALDLAMISHPHADHIGGMLKTLREVPARIFVDPGFEYSSGIYADLLEYLGTTETKVVLARAGRKIDIGGDAFLEILWPRDPLLRGTRSDANSNSVVFRLVYGQTSMLFTGDSEAPTERYLLAEAPEQLQADVLKVAHHGSAHSTQDDFLAAVSPSIAVISAGVNNKFDHPAPSTVDKLTRAGIQVLRTDLGGTVSLVSDGASWVSAVARGDVPAAPPVADAAAPPTRPKLGVHGAAISRFAPVVRMDAPSPAAGASAAPGDKLDINTATASQLTTVKGIGAGKAAAIIAYRDEHGPFARLGDVVHVPGIGARTLARIAEKFDVLASSPPTPKGTDPE